MGQVLSRLVSTQKIKIEWESCATTLTKVLFGRQSKTLCCFIFVFINNGVLIVQVKMWNVFEKCRLASQGSVGESPNLLAIPI